MFVICTFNLFPDLFDCQRHPVRRFANRRESQWRCVKDNKLLHVISVNPVVLRLFILQVVILNAECFVVDQAHNHFKVIFVVWKAWSICARQLAALLESNNHGQEGKAV